DYFCVIGHSSGDYIF
nr:immunoglobulin light chain junction region [Macaca mulatta]